MLHADIGNKHEMTFEAYKKDTELRLKSKSDQPDEKIMEISSQKAVSLHFLQPFFEARKFKM